MGEFGPGVNPEELHPKDLQKEFHRKLKEEGSASAAEFLVERFDSNPAYANREGMRLAASLAERLKEELWSQKNTYKELLIQASVAQLRAQFYEEFGDLSQRQKTKIGFKNFVEKHLDIQQETSETKNFNEEVLRYTGRDSGRNYESERDNIAEYMAKYVEKSSKIIEDMNEALVKLAELQALSDKRGD